MLDWSGIDMPVDYNENPSDPFGQASNWGLLGSWGLQALMKTGSGEATMSQPGRGASGAVFTTGGVSGGGGGLNIGNILGQSGAQSTTTSASAVNAAAPGAGGGLTAQVPGQLAVGGAAAPSAIPAATSSTAVTGGAANTGFWSQMLGSKTTGQWTKLALSAAYTGYTAYQQTKANKEAAEFAKDEANRRRAYETDRVRRLQAGPLAKMAPFLMRQALGIYGGMAASRGGGIDINFIQQLMGLNNLSTMPPYSEGYGGQQFVGGNGLGMGGGNMQPTLPNQGIQRRGARNAQEE